MSVPEVSYVTIRRVIDALLYACVVEQHQPSPMIMVELEDSDRLSRP